MTHVFISYAKSDNQNGEISLLVNTLASTASPIEPDTNIKVWFDEKGIRAGENWSQEIDAGLEQAHTVAIFFSPRYFASQVCTRELQTALQLGKKLIPIWVDVVTAGNVEQEIQKRKSEGKETASLDEAMRNYVAICDKQALRFDTDTELDKVKTKRELITAIFENARLDDGATTWLERALAKERRVGSWLAGSDLKRAQLWLSEAEIATNFVVHEPTKQFILKSKKMVRRRTTALGVVGIIALVLIVIVALEAQRQSRVATENEVEAQRQAQAVIQEEARNESLRLAAEAINILNDRAGNPEQAALLSIRALQTAYTQEADTALVWASAYLPQQTFVGHEEAVTSLVLSPDGRYVLSGSDDTTARLWDTTTGQELRQFSGHTDEVNSVAFSPDGRYILSGSDDTTARLWATATGQELRQFSGHESPIMDVAFSSDGSLVLTGSGDGTARLWDVETGTQLRQVLLEDNDEVAWSVGFSPDSGAFLAGTSEAITHLWNSQTGEELFRFAGDDMVVWVSAFSPDGRYIFTGGEDTGRLWDAMTGEETRQFVGHTDWIRCAVFSADGRYILTGSKDSTARLWDAATGVELQRFVADTDGVNGVAFSPDGKVVFTGNTDGTIRAWNAEPGPGQRQLIGHTRKIASTTFSMDGHYVLSAGSDGFARLWDARTGQEVQVFLEFLDATDVINSTGLNSAALSPNMAYVLTNRAFESDVVLWDAQTGEEIQPLSGHSEEVLHAIFSPDGRYVLTASQDTTARLWDVESRQEIRQFVGHTDWVSSVAYSSDGTRILTGSWDGTARLWDAQTGQELQRFIGNTREVESVMFSPDSRLVLTISFNNPARLWDAQTGQELQQFADTRLAAFSPDGRLVLTVGIDAIAYLRDVETGEVVRTFEGHTRSINSAVFSPDGLYILTGSEDTTARLWNAQTGEELRSFAYTDSVDHVLFSLDSRLMLISSDATLWVWNTDNKDLIDLACARIYRDLTPDERREFSIEDTPTCPKFTENMD